MAFTPNSNDGNSGSGTSSPQVQTDWNATAGMASILNKPIMATVAKTGSYTDLSNKPVMFNGDYNSLSNKPALFDGTWSSLTGKPTLSTVASSGAYVDLSGKPSLFDGNYTSLTNTPVIPAAQVSSDWDATTGVAQILNKPVLFNGTWTSLTGKPVFATVASSGLYSDLSGRPALFDGNYASLTNTPIIPAAQVASDWNSVTGVSQILNKPVLFNGTWTSLSGKPSFATVATSGLYSDLTGRPTLFDGSYLSLTNKPTIPSAQVNSDWSAVSGVTQILNKPVLFDGNYSSLSGKPTLFDGTYASLTGKPVLATVATSGSYLDLTNKPVIPTGFSLATPSARTLALATAYQATDSTKAAFITINITSTSSVSLSGTSNNEGGIYIGPTNAVAAGTGTKVGEYKNSLGGTLVVGLTLTSAQTQPYSIMLPAGWYWSVRQTVGTGISIVSCFEQPVS